MCPNRFVWLCKQIMNAFYSILTFYCKYQILSTCKLDSLRWWKSTFNDCSFFRSLNMNLFHAVMLLAKCSVHYQVEFSLNKFQNDNCKQYYTIILYLLQFEIYTTLCHFIHTVAENTLRPNVKLKTFNFTKKRCIK